MSELNPAKAEARRQARIAELIKDYATNYADFVEWLDVYCDLIERGKMVTATGRASKKGTKAEENYHYYHGAFIRTGEELRSLGVPIYWDRSFDNY